MKKYLSKRILSSLLAVIGLFIMVFFLARLTGDPGHLYLPIDAPLEVRKEFSEKHGFNDPIYVQFGRFVGDLVNGGHIKITVKKGAFVFSVSQDIKVKEKVL